MRSAPRKANPGNKPKAPNADGQEIGSEALFNLNEVFDAIQEGISVHTADGVVLYANARIAEICDKPHDVIVGSRCADLFHIEPHDCPHQDVVESGQRSELKGRQAVGERIYSISCEPIINEAGSLSGYVRLMRDVTERRRAQEELLTTERFATLGQMIFGIAHDVGTPLNIISGYCEYLLMRSKPEDHGHRELSTILQQTRRIADFIKQMLDLARPAQGRADAIGLKGFLTESLDLIGHLLRRENVKASLVFNAEPPLIYSDAPRLRQALFNIFLNVSQRLGKGANLEIMVDESPSDKRLTRISIAGIDREGHGLDFSQSFAGFLDPTQSSEAIGMGLSLARHILDEIGAKVETTDMQGKGTALVVYIPKDSCAHGQQAF
ncbi:MAG TPA: histidine kinase dimerization/phospho-acceptor domain-containing protein [Blastocatellia bacterium]|nr:histidine kinase dimerization/phospho-acceptor domain-containing protein [Blastocatellia bacterium]